MRAFFLCLAAIMLVGCGPESTEPESPATPPVAANRPADLVFRGGPIYTVDPERSWAEVLAVRDGKIMYVGQEKDAADLVASARRVIDLDGKMMIPGIQDVHVHPISGGMEALACDLNAAATVDEYLRIVAECATAQAAEDWIHGGGWSMSAFGPGGVASRQLLDAVVADKPVYLSSADGHTGWANSRALEIAGIDSETPDPPDGRIDREPDTGDPVGSLQEGAMNLVERHLPPVSLDRRIAGLRYSVRMLNAHGITAIQDASVRRADLEAYEALEAEGGLTVRTVAALWWEREQGLEQVSELLALRERYTGGRVDAGTVKIMQDGVMENYTAAMLEPYLVEGSPRGIPMVEPEFLKQVVARLDAEGFQVHFHAIGDAAIRQALDAVAVARDENPGSTRRHHISHLEVIDPADIPRFEALGVVANFQPLWAYPDSYIEELTLPFIGPERGQWLYPIGSVLASGATIAFGSDWSVSTADPFDQMEVAVRRADPATGDGPVLLPEQAISLADAIAAFTINAAFVNRLEALTGSLEEGKSADLVVLDRNLFEIDSSELSETRVLLTMLEGRVVHGTLPEDRQ